MLRTQKVFLCLVMPWLVALGCHGMAQSLGESSPKPVVDGILVDSLIAHRVNPVYPPVAKAAHVQGTVLVHILLSKDGTVKSAEAISGPDLLKGAAVDAVTQWVYHPYLRDGKPVDIEATVTVNFRLAP